jgi:hypothetical protein
MFRDNLDVVLKNISMSLGIGGRWNYDLQSYECVYYALRVSVYYTFKEFLKSLFLIHPKYL